MVSRTAGIVAAGALASALLLPFAFGGVERSVWIPLSAFWIVLGLIASRLSAVSSSAGDGVAGRIVFASLPLHAFFILQLCPLPGSVLGWVSPGSFAAHFLPDLQNGQWRPISVSPYATAEAWLHIAGLQGLFVALRGVPLTWRRRSLYAIVVTCLLLGFEGLWQSRSAHPDWIYGRIPLVAPVGLQNSGFGPYFNRNHFATVTAMAAALSAGLAAAMLGLRDTSRSIIRDQSRAVAFICLIGATGFLLLCTAASGSRSGLLAGLVGLACVLFRRFERRRAMFALIAMAFVAVALFLSGAFAFERLANASVVASRVPAWMDITRLFRFFPAFGAGIGAFAAAYWPYQMNVRYEFWQHAHNEYLEWIVEAGLAGLLLAGLLIRRLRLLVRITPDWVEPCIAASVAFAVQSLFDFPARIPANAAMLICVWALTIESRPHE